MRPSIRGLAAALSACAASALAGPIQPLYDINRTFSVPDSTRSVPVGDRWLLNACVGQVCAPASTDGTPGSVRIVGPRGSPVSGFAVAQGVGYFAGRAGESDLVLYKTDGTAAGTTAIEGTHPSAFPGRMAGIGNQVLFAASDGLWVTDGTGPGTQRLAPFILVDQLVNIGNKVLFVGWESTYGQELWVSDGTAAGTTLVRDIVPGASGTGISGLVAINGRAFFFVKTTANGPPDLWTSDGTQAGTLQVTFGLASDMQSPIVEAGGNAYVVLRNSADLTQRLVRSDGTAAGTSVVRSWLGSTQSRTLLLATAGQRLYFAAPDNTGDQLWASDGTSAGTLRLTSAPVGNPPTNLVSTGNALFFVQFQTPSYVNATYRLDPANDSIAEYASGYKPVGTLGDRVLLAFGASTFAGGGITITPLTTDAGAYNNTSYCARGSIVLGTRVIFAANDGVHGCEPWATDGTTAGTSLLADTVAGPTAAQFSQGTQSIDFAKAGGQAYFLAGKGNQLALWRTDGTAAGTSMAVPYEANRSAYTLLGGAGNYVYYFAMIVGQPALVRSDGTAAGTVTLANFMYFNSLPTAFATATFGDAFYLLLADSNNGITLYRADGAGITTPYHVDARARAVALYAGATTLYLVVYQDNGGSTVILRSDGTTAGTRILQLGGIGTTLVTTARGIQGDVLYVTTVSTNANVPEYTLWRTDGTLPGTFSFPTRWDADLTGATVGNYFYVTGRDLSSLAYRMMRINGGASIDLTPGGRPSGWQASTVAGSGEAAWFFLSRETGNELWSTYGGFTTSLVEDYAPASLSTVRDGLVTAPWLIPAGLVFYGSKGDGLDEPLVMAFDATPDAFPFASQVDVAGGGFTVSAPVFVTGLTQPVDFTVTNGQLCVSSANNCSCDISGYASSGIVGNGAYVCVKQPTSSTPGATNTTTVTIGGVSTTFITNTAPLRHLGVSLAGTGSGRVATIGSTIDCGATCGEDLIQGTMVRLEAIRAPGSVFTGWSGACTGLGACTVQMSSDLSVTATFTAVTHGIATPDFDGDGRADLLFSHPAYGAGGWIMNGNQIVATGLVTPPVAGATIAFVADFDGDGRMDILWRSPSGRYDVSLMAGLRTVTNATFNLGSWQVVAVADLDGDGKADIVLRDSSSGTHGAWLMNGTSIAHAGALPQPTPNATIVRTADFDGDGKADIVWLRADGTHDISLMDGFTVKSTKTIIPGGYGWFVRDIGDFNGDGKADLLWRQTDGSYGLWLMDGTTQLGARGLFGGGTGWEITAVGDLDGNGKSDLLFTHTDGTVGAWLMDGLDMAAPPAAFLPGGSGWSIMKVRDFDGDGKDDVLFRHVSGQYGLWLMDGLAKKATALVLPAGTGWEVAP